MAAITNAKIIEGKNNQVFKLIHVGLPSIDYLLGVHTILCHFQSWSAEHDCALSSNIITRVVNSSLAGSLICGSFWSDWGAKRTDTQHIQAESQVFWLGANPLVANHLSDIINPADLTPANFWANHGDTSVINFKFNGKNIIIPYFELIRTLFYKASQRLTEFLFSHSSLESLCRPFDAPSIANSFLTRFCVASTDLSMLEAQVLAGLLFEPSMWRTLSFAQSYWRGLLIESPLKANKNNPEPRHVGQLDRNILFNAKGYTFICNGEAYFWVNSLETLSSPYNFRNVVFHPIASKKSEFSHYSDLPICSDILQTRSSRVRLMDLWNKELTHTIVNRPIYMKRSKRDKRYIVGVNAHLPHVECGLPWARLPAGKKDFYGLNDPITAISLSAQSLPQSHNDILDTQFKTLLAKFNRAGYTINFLELNNPDGAFGKNISVFPVTNQPPLPAAVHKSLTRTFILAEIQLNNGPIYLAQPFYQECPNLLVFFQKQNLSKPDIQDWNKILNAIPFVNNTYGVHDFYRKVVITNNKNTPYNTALIALPFPLHKTTVELCTDTATHIISKFRKRLQFETVCRQKYPTGMSKEQLQEIVRLSSNICRAPDSNFIFKLAAYWGQVSI